MIPFTGSWVPMTNLFSKHQNPDNLAFHSFLFTGDESRPEGSVRMPTRNLHLMERPISKVTGDETILLPSV